MSRGGIRATACVAVMATGGCALLLDTSELSGEASDAGPVDAPLADAEATPPNTGEGGPEVGPDAAGGCRESFFDSFDDGVLGAKWDSLQQDKAALSFDTDEALSAPRSLLVTITAESGSARLQKAFPASKQICCELAIRGYADYLRVFDVSGRGGNYGLRFSFGSGSFGVAETLHVAAGADDNIDRIIGRLPTPPVDGWQLLRFEASLPPTTGANGSVRVFVDGVIALASGLGSATQNLTLDTLTVGIPYSQVTTNAQIRYDDVGCTFR
jgi:hypothetical protein